jgi:DNA-directed RNA polymerase specialized sigma24 family protein
MGTADGPASERASERASEPWWANDPELQEIIRRSNEQLQREIEACAPLPGPESEPVVETLSPRASLRQLTRIRGELDHLQTRYEKAVLTARNAGLSWAQIGNALGVSKQNLHNRFRDQDRALQRRPYWDVQHPRSAD